MPPLASAICIKCDLHKLAKVNCLRGRGPQNPKLMLIGEAPGEDEDLANQPFVGPAGEVFNFMLYQAGITRDQVYISNTVKCRPVNEKEFRTDRSGVKHFGNLTPTAQQTYTCGLSHLEPEIAAVRPKIIVPMGNIACDYLFDKYRTVDGVVQTNQKTGKPVMARRMPKITDLMFEEYWDQARGVYIVPMFHPAFVMRSQEWFLIMVAILKKAIEIADTGPGTDVTQPFIATNFDDAMAVIRRASEHKVIADDHETDSLDWRFGPLLNIGLSWKTGTGASIRLVDTSGQPLYSNDQRNQIVESLKSIYQNPDKVLVGYNRAFDDSWLEAKTGIKVTAPRHDVQMMYHTLNTAATHKRQNLEMLTWLYTRMANYKKESKPWFDKKQFLECPIDVMSRRNCSDVDATLRLYERFLPKLQSSLSWNHYNNLLKDLPYAATVLHLNGAPVGLEKLSEMRDRLEEGSRELAAEFSAGVGEKAINPRSSKQLASVLFGKLGLPVLERTPTGQPKTSEYILTELSSRCPALKPLMEYKKLQKLLGTYVLGLRGCALFGNSKKRKPDIWSVDEAIKNGFNTDGRVHPSFSVVGTVTGRPSVSKPNIANQPRPTDQQKRLGVVLRQAFQARPGRKIVERDLSQAELRLLAAMSGDKALEEAVNSEEGAHKRTAVGLYKVKLSEVTDDMKYAGKKLNFTIAYGGTEYVVEEDIPEQLDAELIRRFPEQYKDSKPTQQDRRVLAKEFIDLWRAQYPVASAWLDANKEFARKNGYIVTKFGRVFYFPLIFSRNGAVRSSCERAACNYGIQSPASDITFMAGIRVQREIEAKGLKSLWINMTYDSLKYEVPDDEVETIVNLTKREMEQFVPEMGISLLSEVEVGQCWKEDKDADVIKHLDEEDLDTEEADEDEPEEAEA